MVGRMPKNEQDPAGSTQQFRAFASSGESTRQGSNTWMIVGVAIAVIVVIAAVLIFV